MGKGEGLRYAAASWWGRRAVQALIGVVVLLAVVPATASAAECTDNYTGPTEGSWTNASNWSAGHVPTESDIACVASGKSTKMTAAGTQAVQGVQGAGKVAVRESTLNILGTGETWQLAYFTIEYRGALTGPATLAVTSALHWEFEGTMSGSGKTVLGPAAVSTFGNANSWFNIAKRTVINEGTVNQVNYGTLAVTEGGVFENLGTYYVNGEKSSSQIISSGTGSAFINKGTFRKSEGTGIAKISSNFENLSAVVAASGKIKFEGAGNVVSFADKSQLEGAIVDEKNIVAVNNVVAPQASLTLKETALSVPAEKTFSLGSLTMAFNSTVTGAGNIKIEKALTWEAASAMTGTGKTVLGAGSVSTIGSANSSFKVQGRKLVNEGTITQLAYSTLAEAEGGVVENLGTYNANGESSFWQITGEGTGSAFVNKGTFRKTEGTGVLKISSSFENRGAVRIVTGSMKLEGPGNSVSFVDGSTLEGTVACKGPTVTLNNISAPNASITFREEAVTIPAGKTVSFGSFAMSYLGNLTGPGTLEVTKSFAWEGQSSMLGEGKTILGPSSSNVLKSGATTVTLSNRTLVNEGTWVQTESSKLEITATGVFKNLATYSVSSEPSPIWSTQVISGAGRFINGGTFQRVVGTSEVAVYPEFENNGVIKEQSSKVKIERPKTVGATEKFGNRSCSGDPVECATGNFVEAQTDFAIGGRGVGLVLARSYSAQTAAAATSAGVFGYGWSGSFSDRLTIEEGGAKVVVVRGDGSTIPFTRTSGTAYAGPAWTQETLSGSAEAGYTFTQKDRTVFAFSGTGKLETIADRNGNQATLSYDEAGRLKVVTDPGGRHLTFSYTGGGQVESVQDPMGHLVKYAYESGNLVSVTMSGEATPRWQFKYDAKHRITKVTDGRGGETSNEYDSSSRVVSQTDPAGRTLTFKYEPFHTTITNKSTGAVTDKWFNSNNEPYSITRGYGTAAATTESFSYSDAGRLIRVTDGNGGATTYGYDEEGNRTSETDPLGHETKWTWDGAHDVISVTTPRGETTTIERDSHGNVESISRPASGEVTQTTTFSYDEHGQLESVTNPLGRTWTYGYDGYGDCTSETDPLGEKQTTTYDADSRVVSVVSPRGNAEGGEPAQYTTTVERDAQGRPLKIIDALGHATEYAYDGNGNLSSVTDAKGHTTTFTYNADDERTKIEKPDGATLQTGYDGAGYVNTQTDGNGKTTSYVRNVLEQPAEVIDPLGRKTVKTFDTAGNLVSLVDPAERKTTYSYDADERLAEINYSEEATADVGFEYDLDGNVIAITDGTGESSFSYDDLGRLTQSENGHGDVVGYNYDLAEEQTGIVYFNGKEVSRAYDEAGRLASVTDWLGGTTTFGYDADSNLTGIAFPVESGTVDEYAFDRASRMSEARFKQGSETLASLAYVRDAVGQIEEEARSGLPGAEELSYGYDQNNRLVEAGAASFEYDAADNLTKGMGSANAYDAAGQLETGTGITYNFDNLGERAKATPASGPATTYGYDQAGDLVSISRPEESETPAISETLAYDGSGLLASRASGLTTRHLAWDASPSLPLLLSDGERSYVYGPAGLAIEQISSEEPTYLHHDQLGSTRMLTGASGETTATFSYVPYGGLEARTGTATTPFGFTGQYTDAETGLQYLRARFYDPETGQFLSRDPIEALTRQPYAYGFQDPLNTTDPSGLAGELVVGGCAAGEVVDPFGGCAPGAAAGGVAEVGKVAGVALSSWVFSELLDGEESSGESEEATPCPSALPNFDDPTQPPGPEWEWKGRGPAGSREGSWYNPDTEESLHPDLEHPKHGPHYDYLPYRDGPGSRIYPDGAIEPK